MQLDTHIVLTHDDENRDDGWDGWLVAVWWEYKILCFTFVKYFYFLFAFSTCVCCCRTFQRQKFKLRNLNKF